MAKTRPLAGGGAPGQRQLRVGEVIRRALSEILARGEVHDPDLGTASITVAEVKVSPDLRHATAFVKPLLSNDEDVVLKALRTNTAYLQREVAKRTTRACRPFSPCSPRSPHG